MSKISIIVPVFNVDQYIARAIDSVLSQSFRDIELILVDDCSLDKSLRICKQYAEEDDRIIVLEENQNVGPMKARQDGINISTGDYITFLDSDDELPHNALELLHSSATTENADIVSGVIQHISAEGCRSLWNNRIQYGTDNVAAYKALLRDEFCHNICSKLFRRSLLTEYGYETHKGATNGEDGILFYQVLENTSKIIAIDSIVYKYFQNPSSSTHQRLSEKALRSIFIANYVRVKTTGKYHELSKDLFHKESSVLWELKSQGYHINNLLIEYNLTQYCSITLMVRKLGLKNALALLAKYAFHKLQNTF